MSVPVLGSRDFSKNLVKNVLQKNEKKQKARTKENAVSSSSSRMQDSSEDIERQQVFNLEDNEPKTTRPRGSALNNHAWSDVGFVGRYIANMSMLDEQRCD